jgi:hypothetical protein
MERFTKDLLCALANCAVMFVAPYDAAIGNQLTYTLFASLSSLGARSEDIAA